jgi:hypothetical protein
MKFKTSQQQDLELQDVETVDLTERLSPVLYDSIAPHEYRKLHALHTSVQGGRESTIRLLLKKKSQYSYASQDRPENSSRLEKAEEKDVFGFDDSSSDGIFDSASYSDPAGNGLSATGQDFQASNFEVDSLASLRPTSLIKDSASDKQVRGLSGTALDNFAKKTTNADQQGEVKHHRLPWAEQSLRTSSVTRVPEWVNEMDPSLIDFLGNSVEYID